MRHLRPRACQPWSQFWSHSPPSATVHRRLRAPHPRWSGRWRTPVNGGAQYSKACEGASLPWVQIPPPPPLTCDDASSLCLLGGGGHPSGLSFGPQLVSVDRAEMPAAGWIGPELWPCLAADMIWEETRRVPVSAGRSPCPGRRARQAGCRLPVSGRTAEPMRTPPKRAPCRSGLADRPWTYRPHHSE